MLPVRRIATPPVARGAMMAGAARLSAALLALGAVACEPQRTATLDDALRAYEGGRYQDALRMSRDLQTKSTDAAERQQAAYVAGCSAQELGRDDDARASFAVAARSGDPVVAGRALVMQGNMAAETKRWSDAEALYSQAASKLRGRDAELAREQARDAAAQATAARKAAQAPPPSPPPAPQPAGNQGVGTKPAPAPAPAPADQGPFTIRSGAFSSETGAQQHARNIAKAVRAAGLRAPKVRQASTAAGRLWVVEFGEFATKAEAEQKLKRLGVGSTQILPLKGS